MHKHRCAKNYKRWPRPRINGISSQCYVECLVHGLVAIRNGIRYLSARHSIKHKLISRNNIYDANFQLPSHVMEKFYNPGPRGICKSTVWKISEPSALSGSCFICAMLLIFAQDVRWIGHDMPNMAKHWS